MQRRITIDPESIDKQSEAIVHAVRLAVRDALIDHKLKGDPIVVCDDDGNPRWIPADEIVIPEVPEQP